MLGQLCRVDACGACAAYHAGHPNSQEGAKDVGVSAGQASAVTEMRVISKLQRAHCTVC